MEIKPTGKPTVPEPAEAPTAPAPAGPAKAKAHLAAAQDHLEVYVPPKLDLGHGDLGRLPDPSDLGKLRHDLRSELPADLGIGPAAGNPPTPAPVPPPDPDPPPPEDFVSKFRDPMIDRAAFSPEIGGTEHGPQGTPKKPAIKHGLGPGHFTTPVPGPKGPIGPDGFDKPGMPRTPDPRTSAPTRTEPGPAKPPDEPNPPDPPENLAFSGLIAQAHRAGATSYQDGDDMPAISGRIGAARQGETFGVQDPGPPVGPQDPGPPEPPPKPDGKPIG